MSIRAVLAAALIGLALPAMAETATTNWPNYQESDFLIENYRFASGEILPQLKLHYRTFGSAQRNAAGEIVNGVAIRHDPDWKDGNYDRNPTHYIYSIYSAAAGSAR